MYSDQTAPPGEQSDLGPNCLQYRLPKFTASGNGKLFARRYQIT